MDLSTKRIYVAGHRGMVGSAIVRRLKKEGAEKLILRDRSELDLTNQAAVESFFQSERPQVVFLAAAKVGGIHANSTYPAEFIRDNLAIQTNVIHSAWKCGVEKLCFLGSSCIYPKHAPQPLKEEYLLSGPLEPTNEWYAIAKIAGIKMCQAYRRQYGFDAISLMPTNLYGPGDNFHPENSHVLPALIRRFHEARAQGAEKVVIWGSGQPRREFLHVDDLASAACHFTSTYSDNGFLNVGTGQDLKIIELAELIASIVGYEGRIDIDPSRPDGTPRKLLDVNQALDHGWEPSILLEEGIQATYSWYCSQMTRS
jgi:GDP-L-fucose synthase